MSKQTLMVHVLAIGALALSSSVGAQAAASRTFVSTTGSDANAAVNCSATATCRTFGAALSVTNPGGELVVVNSGGYGPATITQPVIITATGIDASISVTTSGANAITINTSGNVTLTGLNLHGEATGQNGVAVQQVGFLRLYDMLVENFMGIGVDLEVPGSMAVYGLASNDNGGFGLRVANSMAIAYVERSSFDHNGTAGAAVASGQLTVVDSASSNNGNGFRVFGSTATMTLFNDRAQFNLAAGLFVFQGAMYFSNCFISNNTMSYNLSSGGTLTGTNPGTNFIAPGQTSMGALSTAIPLL